MGRFQKHDPKTYESKKVATAGGAGVAVGTTVGRATAPLAKGAGVAGKVASKVAPPLAGIAAAYGAYKGAGEDDNTLRGAGRGVVNALDPSTLVRNPGYGQEAYDRQFGKADPVKMQSPSWGERFDSAKRTARDWGQGMMDRFHEANRKYNPLHASGQPPEQSRGNGGVIEGGRGWANPKVQEAAQEARKAKRGQ